MIRVGIVGCGGIGKHHAARLVEMPGVKITVACDIIPERADKLAGRYDARAVYSHKEMMDDVDVAWVCTIPNTHADISIDCLNAGKDVFCEKPMAVSVEDADRMMAAAKTSGKLLAIGYCLRFSSWLPACRQVVDDGILGEITSVWTARMGSIPTAEWAPFEAKSGGMLSESTTHNIDWLRAMAGDVESVFARGATVTEGADILDNISGVIGFRSGAMGQVMSSWSAATGWVECGIIGTKGVLRTCYVDDIHVTALGQETYTIKPQANDMYADEQAYFMDCVRTGKPFLFDVEEAKKSLAVGLAMHRSARAGQVVTL